MSRHERRAMIDRGHHELSVVRQCELLDISRSSAYYSPVQADEYELELMGLVDKQYLLTAFYGSRKMAVWLRGQGHQVNRKRVQRLMRRMGIEAIYRRPRTTMPDSGHKVYPYLLRGLEIDRVNQVWAADITYIPMVHGFMYLVCVMDWHSRYVLSWRLSNTLEADSCVDALEEALSRDLPGVFNTDQGSQFTSEAFTSVLVAHGVRISMDSVGSYMDNVFVEPLWRSVKYEEVYLKAYESVAEARAGIGAYLRFYDSERPHQTLDYRTPAQVFEEGRNQVHQSEVNHKRVYRLYRLEGLRMRPKRPRRHVSSQKREVKPQASRPDERWAMDFRSDELFDGRRIRILTLVDHFTRESLDIEVDGSIGGQRVAEVLARLALQGRKPQTIAMDNGPEFTSKRLDQWAYLNGVELDFSRPGKPTDNAMIEAFNARLREECLNESWFLSLEDAREKIEGWRRHYNGERPHGALGNLAPQAFALVATAGVQ